MAGYNNVPFTDVTGYFRNRHGIRKDFAREKRIETRRDREIRQGTAEVLELQIESEETDE